MKAVKSSRVNSAIKVIQCLNEGMTAVDACKKIGIPRSSFYEICKRNPEAIAEVQDIIDTTNREQLGLILLNKTEVLSKVIADGLADSTTPRDRLEIFKALSELVDDLSYSLQIESQAAKEAHEFLKKGPVISPQISRLSATQTTILIESKT